jgi:hypothetical protein
MSHPPGAYARRAGPYCRMHGGIGASTMLRRCIDRGMVGHGGMRAGHMHGPWAAMYVALGAWLGCSTGTGTGTGDPVPGSPDPVVNNARWRPLGSQGEKKTRKIIIFTAIYIQIYIRMRLQNQATGTAHARLPSGGHGPSCCHLRTLLIAPQAALAAVWRWPNPISS